MKRYAYTIELTADEYASADCMSYRGYLGNITGHADVEWSEDETIVTLQFTEPQAWAVLQTIEDDPDAVWSLTTPRTTLGQKFQAFLDSIV
jgi:hypothetical protein